MELGRGTQEALRTQVIFLFLIVMGTWFYLLTILQTAVTFYTLVPVYDTLHNKI